MLIEGKYNKAEIFAEHVEASALQQIYHMLNHPAFADGRIAVMPDVHCGKGSVIGFTMELGDALCPWVIGVDIGCGIDAYHLGEIETDFAALDTFIRRHIPSGFKHHKHTVPLHGLEERVVELVRRLKTDKVDTVLTSPGTLGGGNHFIELNKGATGYWLVLHSGSRHLGVIVAEQHAHRALAKQQQNSSAKGLSRDLPFYQGKDCDQYLQDMAVAQEYAVLNRRLMAEQIIGGFFRKDIDQLECVSSIHNYISFDDNIIRKGAIAAHAGQQVVIPLNMRDGTLLGTGKGNPEWNHSAPHGAGRVMSRTAAKKQIKLEDFQEAMHGIYSTSVSRATVDEAPFVYKPMDEIITALAPAVEIRERLIPVYNFKAG